MEVTPVLENPSSALVRVESIEEELAIVKATGGMMRIPFAPLGLILTSDISRLLDSQEYPKELHLKYWELSLIADGLKRLVSHVDSFETMEHCIGMAGDIHAAGFGDHWSTRIIRSRK